MKNLLTSSLLLALCLLCSVGSSQTIFRATPIDEEQNIRLDNLEAKFESLEDSIKNLTDNIKNQNRQKLVDDFNSKVAPKQAPKSSCNCSDKCTCDCDGECSCSCSTKIVTQYIPVPTPSYNSTGGSVSYNSSVGYYNANIQRPTTVSPNYGSTGGYVSSTNSSGYSSQSSSSSLSSQIRAKRTGRTYAIVSAGYAKTHLLEHGYSAQELAGLSTSEAVELHNLTHGGLISPSGMGGQSAMRTTTYQVQRPRVTRTRTVSTSSACANGQCNTRRGIFGFRR